MRSLLFIALAVLSGCGGADPAAGATVYTASCASCHAADGTGAVAGAADLTVRVPAMTDADLENAVNNGVGTMAPVTLSAADLADLIAHLRDTFGGGA